MIDTDKYEGHTEGPWSIKTGNAGHSVKDANGDHVCTIPDPTGMSNKHIIADAPLLLAEIKRLREELFNTHAFYANMEQMLAFAVGIKQGLLTNLSMDDLVDAMNRDYHDRLNEHMDGRLIE